MSIEPVAPNTVDFDCKVNGKDVTLKIKTDLTWGETQDLLTRSVKVLDSGVKDFNFNNFCDILLAKTIISGLGFDAKNMVKMKNLPASEISIILGEIMKIIPLESYFSNLGMDKTDIQKP